MSNAVFPSLPGLKWDVTKAPQWLTKVQRAIGGKEMRAAFWSYPIYTWTLSYELLRTNALLELQSLLGFFQARQGSFDSFLFPDPNDNTVAAHGFGVGDGAKTAFQLQRTIAGPRVVNSWDPTIYPVSSVPRSNVLLWSNDFTNAAWGRSGGTLPVVTANQGLAPDGTLTADKVVFVAPTGADSSIIAQDGTFTINAGVQYTGSFWVKAFAAGDIGKTIAFRGVGRVAYTLVVLTANWQRVQAPEIAFNANNYLGIGLSAASGSSTGTVSVLLAAAQEEPSALATANIPTTTSIVTVNPAYWPTAGDGFEPVFDLDYSPTAPQIFVSNVLKSPVTDYTISTSGVVTFSAAPAAGAALSWTGSYFWRVRFDLDQLEFNNFLSQLWEAKKVTLVSVKT